MGPIISMKVQERGVRFPKEVTKMSRYQERKSSGYLPNEIKLSVGILAEGGAREWEC